MRSRGHGRTSRRQATWLDRCSGLQSLPMIAETLRYEDSSPSASCIAQECFQGVKQWCGKYVVLFAQPIGATAQLAEASASHKPTYAYRHMAYDVLTSQSRCPHSRFFGAEDAGGRPARHRRKQGSTTS
nr:hypothetical protein CFP56_09084 [Quercus suber]